jgi:hypothetical protein
VRPLPQHSESALTMNEYFPLIMIGTETTAPRSKSFSPADACTFQLSKTAILSPPERIPTETPIIRRQKIRNNRDADESTAPHNNTIEILNIVRYNEFA